MYWTNIKRIMKAGFVNFWRNGVISVASIFVVVVTLFIMGSIILAHALLASNLAEVKDKVDVNVYFKANAPENEILAIKDELENMPAVKSIDYISRDQALAQFRERNKDNQLILQSLDELEENPFGAAFNIKAHELTQYENIAAFLNQEKEQAVQEGKDAVIDEVTYTDDQETQAVVKRLDSILASTTKIGWVTSLLLSVMAALVTFNTVRLAIYNMRQEIYIMRLVGANNSFIRGPFVVEGVMYGIAATIITVILLYPATLWVSKNTSGIYGGIDLFKYFGENFGQLFVVLLGTGIFLGMISSLVAVRRYLK